LSIRPAAWNDSRENTKGLLEAYRIDGEIYKTSAVHRNVMGAQLQ